MAPKPKKESKEKEEEPAAQTEVVPESTVEQLSGRFMLSTGATYVGQYTKTTETRAPSGEQGTALEPLPEQYKLEIHGNGQLLTGPELFDGEWKNGQMVKGKHIFASGAVYQGQFWHSKFHGYGTYCWPDGREYTGYWAEGTMHGEGTYRHFTGAPVKQETSNGGFAGFSVRGAFQSAHGAQAEAKAAFAEDYQRPFLASAQEALAAGSGGAWPELLVAPALEAHWAEGLTVEAVKALELEPEKQEEREATLREFPETDVLAGPFPTAASFVPLQELVTGLSEDPPTSELKLCVETQAVPTTQLRYLGQCVELVGASSSAVLCHVGPSRLAVMDVEFGPWRLVHINTPE